MIGYLKKSSIDFTFFAILLLILSFPVSTMSSQPSSIDNERPYITYAVYRFAPLGEIFDTLIVFFSEPVLCSSIKSGNDPSESFKIHSPEKDKQIIMEEAWYQPKDTCSDTYISSVNIIISANINRITPETDSMQIIGTAVDTAGNLPDTANRSPVSYYFRRDGAYYTYNTGCGCGTGTGYAFFPPFLFKAARWKRRFRKNSAQKKT